MLCVCSQSRLSSRFTPNVPDNGLPFSGLISSCADVSSIVENSRRIIAVYRNRLTINDQRIKEKKILQTKCQFATTITYTVAYFVHTRIGQQCQNKCITRYEILRFMLKVLIECVSLLLTTICLVMCCFIFVQF